MIAVKGSLQQIPLRKIFRRFFGLASFFFLTTCSVPVQVESPPPTETALPPLVAALPGPTPTPFQPREGTAFPIPLTSQSTPESPSRGVTLWMPPFFPVEARDRLRLPVFLELAEVPVDAAMSLVIGDSNSVGDLVYALVTPFPTLTDGVAFADLEVAWEGEGQGPFAGLPLMMAPDTLTVLAEWWGDPAPDAVRVLPPDELLEAAWEAEAAWAVVPFEALHPRWKVLTLDGVSPIWKEFEPQSYPLTVPVSLVGERAVIDSLLALYGPESEDPFLFPGNRDPEKLTILVMTGVTALVRATAWTMELRGITYPARDIGDWLREADITHISNEVPFARSCPPPNPAQEGVVFCSDPRYIELMEDVGTDIVELTGDHFQDWGVEAMFFTLEMYRERDWPYYGGGENHEDGRRAVTLAHNGNRFAFIGCNGKGRPFAGATAGSPGAVLCDWDFMHAEIARLREDGYLPIVTFQHHEYYTYQALPNQIADFGGMAEAGAVIVSGSQAHHPQAMAFDGDAFIHYGLGNLFFDQLDVGPGTKLAFIDRHVIYDGEYLSTELLTIIFEDYARARPMLVGEREQLLRNTFAASGW